MSLLSFLKPICKHKKNWDIFKNGGGKKDQVGANSLDYIGQSTLNNSIFGQQITLLTL